MDRLYLPLTPAILYIIAPFLGDMNLIPRLKKKLKIVLEKLDHWEFGRDSPYVYIKYFLTPFQLLNYLKGPLVFRVLPKQSDPLIIDDPYLQLKLEELRKTGITILDQYFDEYEIDVWRKQLNLVGMQKNKEWSYTKGKIKEIDDFNCIFADTDKWKFLKLISAYYGKQAYFRDSVSWSLINLPNEDFSLRHRTNSDNIASKWHFDTLNQTTCHVFMTDRCPDQATTEFALRSHSTFRSIVSPRIDWFYSDKYVRDKYETFCAYGKKGTVVLFDSNMLHRAYIGSGGRRENLHINFTPGNNLRETRLPLIEFLNFKSSSTHAYWLSLMGEIH